MSRSFGSLVKTENFVSDIRSLMNMIYREMATVRLLFEFFYLNFGLNSVVNNLFDSYYALLLYIVVIQVIYHGLSIVLK
jgi:hypothetical protein